MLENNRAALSRLGSVLLHFLRCAEDTDEMPYCHY